MTQVSQPSYDEDSVPDIHRRYHFHLRPEHNLPHAEKQNCSCIALFILRYIFSVKTVSREVLCFLKNKILTLLRYYNITFTSEAKSAFHSLSSLCSATLKCNHCPITAISYGVFVIKEEEKGLTFLYL